MSMPWVQYVQPRPYNVYLCNYHLPNLFCMYLGDGKGGSTPERAGPLTRKCGTRRKKG